MTESAEITLPKGLKHWINSIKTASCTLFNDLQDLRDGNCIRELVEHMFHCKIAVQERTPAGLIQGSINTIGENIGFNSFPREFQSPSAAFKLSQGEAAYTVAFVQFLHDLALERAEGARVTAAEADVQHALDETRDDIEQQVHSHLNHIHHMSDPSQPYINNTLDDVPLTYEEYMYLEMEQDSLQGSQELNVMNSADFRSKRLTQGHKTHKNGLKGANKPTVSTLHGGNRTKSPVSRFSTAPVSRVRSVHSSIGSSGVGSSVSDGGSGSDKIVFSGVQSAPTPLVIRKNTPLRNITNTTTVHTTTTHTSTGTGTKAKPTTTPTNIKVHNTGLHMSTLHDPTYKPKSTNLFAQTVVPVIVSSSESSDSEDSIQPTYDYVQTGSSGSRSRGRNSNVSGNSNIGMSRRFPHSRSVSPGGRRHIHNQLHSIQQSIHNNTNTGANTTTPSTHNAVYSTQFGVVNRSVSPNEARLSRFYPYQQPYNTDADIAYPTHPTAHPGTHGVKPNPNQLKPSKLGEDPIKTHQMRAVRRVFKRNEQHQPIIANIDDVISIERKNSILLWIQRQLGINIDVYINSTTSSAYNKTAGKNVVSPDTVAVIPHSSNGGGSSGNVYVAGGNIHAPTMRRDKHAPNTNTNNTSTTNNNQYAFYPTPEAAHYTTGRTVYMHGTYSIATYLGRVTNSVPEYTANAAVQVNNSNNNNSNGGTSSGSSGGTSGTSGGVLQIPAGFVDQVGFSVPPRVPTPHTSIGLLNDPWGNGTLLSEVLACTSGENRATIKQVENYDRFGKLLSVPKLIVAGTEHTVRSKAQAMHNVQLCLDYLQTHIPLFPTLDYSAEDIVSGSVSLWRLLDVVFEHCRGRGRGRGRGVGRGSGSGGGRGGSRGRSVSPGAGQRNCSPLRSISAPPESRLHNNNNATHSTHHGNVHFADSSEHSRANVPVPASPPRRIHTNSSVRNSGTSKGVRSRSVSPSSVHSTGGIDTGGVSKLEQRRNEADSERIKAREYRQRMLHNTNTNINTGSSGGTLSTSSAASVDKERGWSNSTAVEKPRSGSARRGSVTSTNTNTNTNTNTSSTNDAAIPTTSTASTTTNNTAHTNNTNNTTTTHPRHSKHWLPPRLSPTEIEAARNTYLPNVTIFQMRAIRDWLNNAFSIKLLDAECGFGYMGVISGSSNTNIGEGNGSSGTANKNSATTNTTNPNTRTDARFDPKYTHPSTTTPPPLPIQQDRLRNGVLLGLLLMRLEPVAAIHAHIPRLLHKTPRTIELCTENIERVLFVFKVRRSPPLPHHYLCLSEEILNGNDRVIWGLLWEIMQAYPYNALQTLHNKNNAPASTTHTNHTTHSKYHKHNTTSDSYTTHTNNDILYADSDTLIPVPGNGPLKNPPNNTHNGNKTHTKSRTNLDKTHATFGLKGDEARFNVPQYMRYNYTDGELEHPVAVHTLPYSDAQRHALDKSLLAWLDDTNILSGIIGALALPVTVLALESYCRDGTLFCTLTTEILGLTLTKPHILHPTTYTECMNNIKLCTEVLRKCQNMRSRCLYSGVEEHICGGRWDSILGLLEDMHRYADNVHIHANTYSTVDVYGRVSGSSGSGFELNRVEMPYLGKYGKNSTIGGHDNNGDDGNSGNSGGISSGASGNNRSMTTAQSADLLHDVPYQYEPQLHIHHTPPTNTNNTNTTHTVSLDHDINPLLSPQSKNKPTQHMGGDEFIPSVRTGDLFPSNPVSGQNVVNMLKQRTTNTANNANTNNSNATNTATNTTTSKHTSHIPTPIRRTSPIRGTSVPSWVVQDTPPHTTYTKSNSGDVLAQMLDIESDTDAHESRSPHRYSNMGSNSNSNSGSGSGGNTSSGSGRANTPTRLRSALKTTTHTTRTSSTTPTRTPTRTTSTTHTTPTSRRVHTPHTSTANTSTYSRDSLDYPSSLESSPESNSNTDTNNNNNTNNTNTAANTNTTPNTVRSNNTLHTHITKADKQKLYKWLNSIGVAVPMRSERTFLSNDIFSDGVYLCMIVQKLERIGTIPGTFSNPRTQSERVQNIRRVLELLATKHKNIPLRALSCEDDVLRGDLNRTIELLLCIKKAYKNSRL